MFTVMVSESVGLGLDKKGGFVWVADNELSR
jgi:hypothetical protein